MSIPPKSIYRFNANPIKILKWFFFFFTKWQTDYKIYIEIQRTYYITLKMEDKVGVFTLNNFKISNKATWHWHKGRQRTKWKTADNTETDPCKTANVERSLNILQYQQLVNEDFFVMVHLCVEKLAGARGWGDSHTRTQKSSVQYSTCV